MNIILKKLFSFGLAVAVCAGVSVFVGSASSKEYADAVSTVEYSDAVSAYYSGISATQGTSLLGQVHDLITTTHKTYTSYTDCKTPETVMKTDGGAGDYTVMDFYTQEDISATWNGNSAGTWNREHVWCQSLSGGLWGTSGGGSDMHHLRPSEVRLNGTRGNNTFGEVTNGTPAYYKDTSSQDKYVGGYVSGTTFEPLDKVKGDVARIVMYVYAHYNTYKNVGGTTNGSGSSGYFGTLTFTQIMTLNNENSAIALLLKWNEEDPVDEIETTRNEAVYSLQGNRNPFIDHPEYADAIWGDTPLDKDPSETPDPDKPDPDNPNPVDPDNPNPVDPDNPNPVDPDNPNPDNPNPIDPDNPDPEVPDKTDEKVRIFQNAVSAISSDGLTLEQRFKAINVAIAAYADLSEEGKEAARADIITLQIAISDYNRDADYYNNAANASDKAGLSGLGYSY